MFPRPDMHEHFVEVAPKRWVNMSWCAGVEWTGDGWQLLVPAPVDPRETAVQQTGWQLITVEDFDGIREYMQAHDLYSAERKTEGDP